MLIEGIYDFLSNLTFWQVVAYFWPFFFIDMVRYVLVDLLLVCIYMPLRFMKRGEYRAARKQLYRERPLVSVIVPGKNEGRHIPELAASMKKQSYKNYELIIVDDGSDDDTENICRSLEQSGHIDLFIRNSVRGGKASAANTALYYSKGEYVVHIDADSHLAFNAIETILLPFYMDRNVGAVGGDIRVYESGKGVAVKLQAIEYLKSISTGRTVSSMLGILRMISGAHGAFRRDILKRLHGWDVGPGLDGDITLKIRKLGYRVVHEPFAVCYTNVPGSFPKLVRQRYRWDRSLVRFRLRKHSDILKPSKSFNIHNFFSSFENIFYNLIMNVKWWIYILQIIIFNTELILYIALINYFLYTIANILQFIFALILLRKSLTRKDKYLSVFLPLMPIYTGIFLRMVRTFAYLMEIFHRTSYRDKWNPWKVSKIAKSEGL